MERAELQRLLRSSVLLRVSKISHVKPRLRRPIPMIESNPGRPPELTEHQADELLQRITDGDSLLDIVQSNGDWPSYRTIFRRIESDSDFRDRYDRARAIQAERWADELITLSDSLPEDATVEQIAAAKLQIETRRWVISKRLPKKYGDAPTSSLNVTSTTNNFLLVTEAERLDMIEQRKRLQGLTDSSDNPPLDQ